MHKHKNTEPKKLTPAYEKALSFALKRPLLIILTGVFTPAVITFLQYAPK